MGDDQDRALVVDQVLLEPGDGLGVEVVGGLVEEQHVGRLEQEAAEGDAACLAPRERVGHGVVGRAAQRLHRDVDLAVEVPEVLRVDLVLEARHLLGGLVGVVHGEVVVALEDGALGRNALHHVAADVEGGVELRLLREVADAGALGGPGLAGEVLVEAGHDLEQGRLAGAVGADDADLDAGQEAQADVLEQLLAAGNALGHPVHVKDVLVGCHGWAPAGFDAGLFEPGQDMQRGPDGRGGRARAGRLRRGPPGRGTRALSGGGVRSPLGCKTWLTNGFLSTAASGRGPFRRARMPRG